MEGPTGRSRHCPGSLPAGLVSRTTGHGARSLDPHVVELVSPARDGHGELVSANNGILAGLDLHGVTGDRNRLECGHSLAAVVGAVRSLVVVLDLVETELCTYRVGACLIEAGACIIGNCGVPSYRGVPGGMLALPRVTG